MGVSRAAIYDGLVVLVLLVHLLWILWVILGALFTRGRTGMTAFHIASLVWGIVVETGPWACPLTLSEQFFAMRAGLTPYRGSFLIHYLDRIVYPDVPVRLLTYCGVAVCGVNLLVYLYRAYKLWRRAPVRGKGNAARPAGEDL